MPSIIVKLIEKLMKMTKMSNEKKSQHYAQNENKIKYQRGY